LKKLLTSWISSEPILIPRTSLMSSSRKSSSLCLAEIRETWWLTMNSKKIFLNLFRSQLWKKRQIKLMRFLAVLQQTSQMLKSKWSNSLIRSFSNLFLDTLNH
jgi:hypothetical protein